MKNKQKYNLIKEIATKKIIEYKNILYDLKKDNPTFCVNVVSFWEDYGEKSIEFISKGKLEDVLVQADRKFSQVNNRDDYQRGYKVFVVNGDTKLKVPKQFFDTKALEILEAKRKEEQEMIEKIMAKED